MAEAMHAYKLDTWSSFLNVPIHAWILPMSSLLLALHIWPLCIILGLFVHYYEKRRRPMCQACMQPFCQTHIQVMICRNQKMQGWHWSTQCQSTHGYKVAVITCHHYHTTISMQVAAVEISTSCKVATCINFRVSVWYETCLYWYCHSKYFLTQKVGQKFAATFCPIGHFLAAKFCPILPKNLLPRTKIGSQEVS